jgi:hypothetical protein
MSILFILSLTIMNILCSGLVGCLSMDHSFYYVVETLPYLNDEDGRSIKSRFLFMPLICNQDTLSTTIKNTWKTNMKHQLANAKISNWISNYLAPIRQVFRDTRVLKRTLAWSNFPDCFFDRLDVIRIGSHPWKSHRFPLPQNSTTLGLRTPYSVNNSLIS